MRANFSLTSGWMNRSVSSASAIAISIGAAAVIVLANITGLGQVRLAPPGNSRTEGHRTTSTTREHIRQAIASVGVLLVRNGGPGSGQQVWPRGSAVVVRKDGIIATNLHVVTQDNSGKPFEEIYFALPDEKHPSWLSQSQYRVRVLLASQRYDLALLEILPDGSGQLESPSRQFPAIQLGDSRHAKILDSIAVIGYPETGGTTVTANLGVVEGTDPVGDWIKTDARLIHGNSGGAVVDDDGKLIGIPTKIVLDDQDRRTYGAVGFLRPSYLVGSLLERLGGSGGPEDAVSTSGNGPAATRSDGTGLERPSEHDGGATFPEGDLITVKGLARSVTNGNPIAGVRVGLIQRGSGAVTKTNLLTWGGTNSEGVFQMNRGVPKGQYTLKARAIGYEDLTLDVRVDRETGNLVLELKPAP